MVGTTGGTAHAVTDHNKHHAEDICPAPWSTGRKPAGWGMKDAAVAEGLATSSYVQCSAPCRCSIKSLTAQWFRGVHGGHLKARNEVWGSLGLLPSLPFPL